MSQWLEALQLIIPGVSGADSPIHGPEGLRFYPRPKAVTTRWTQPAQQLTAGFNFPTSH
ncbi:hypothetical protein [Streptomyces flaveus]|uniref:Uncharacterized protein n=1 Tax=Streptomyces flaveus TaxID=66370 RepID=A0A917VAQ5_9ACTN|nr:hypothetical protein [Streptomyces flaveus]GGK55058.1 hypothetical protein GCM10010094_14410 [Streptomyces flaveus]